MGIGKPISSFDTKNETMEEDPETSDEVRTSENKP